MLSDAADLDSRARGAPSSPGEMSSIDTFRLRARAAAPLHLSPSGASIRHETVANDFYGRDVRRCRLTAFPFGTETYSVARRELGKLCSALRSSKAI